MSPLIPESLHRVFAVVLLLLLAPVPVLAGNCNLSPPLVSSDLKLEMVEQVIDGDTVRLHNKKLVRFIGVNTPEIDHQHGNSDPLADTAREFLQTLIDRHQGSILLQNDSEPEDRHGRQLAHVFTPQGENIQALLIAKGLGVWITVPPNFKHMSCYHQQEQKARQQRLGVWAAQFRVPYATASLNRKNRGFVWMSGKVTRIGEGKKYIWLNFGDNVAVQVHKDDLHFFPDPTFKTLKNQTVTIKGWLYPYKQQMVMRLRHPASMEILNQ